MNRTKLFLDFDGTIVNSVKAFCKCYNKQYKYNENFKRANWEKVNKWNFSDQCQLLESVEEIFDSKYFFNQLEFFPNAKEVLYELNKKYKVTICSIGRPANIARKSLWIYENLEFIDNVILIKNGNCNMDKSVINMSGGIFIDDVASNLESSNADKKFCYGKKAEWNENWDGNRIVDWDDVGKILL